MHCECPRCQIISLLKCMRDDMELDEHVICLIMVDCLQETMQDIEVVPRVLEERQLH